MARRILIVEDHVDTRVILSMLLRRAGYEVVAAVSKSEAIAACEHQQFDLLIGDIGLPDGNGIDLMRELAEQCHIRGIAYTGYGLELDVAAARKAGFSAHLIKPVENERLLGTIERLLADLPEKPPMNTPSNE